MTKEKYMEFMGNPANVCKCADCPENRREKSMSDFRLPCGQTMILCFTTSGWAALE